jgi:hypothetical protein
MPNEHVICVIWCPTGYIKIEKSVDSDERLLGLQTDNPERLTIAG